MGFSFYNVYMKILVASWKGDGAWFVWLLRHNGHDVDWTIEHEEMADTLEGIIPKPKSRVRVSDYDLIVFDCTSMGDKAQEAIDEGALVIGDCALSDQLEDDRLFGIEAMEEAGIKVPAWEPFSSPSEAIAWLKKTHKRCVLKPIGEAPSEMTYVSKGEDDMVNFIETRLPGSKVQQFLLQEFVQGTEVSTEGWWNGNEWLAVNYTLEEKKFMAGGLGPNTGCAGNVVWMPERETPLFQEGLKKISPLLVDANYRGMIDLNTIVTEGGVYGLEWTPRFGYEGSCNLTRLLPIDFGEFMYAVASGNKPSNLTARARFAATVRLSVPPYPSHDVPAKMKAHQPIKGLDIETLDTFFLFDVKKEDGGLIVCGEGNIGSPIGCSESIQGAFAEVEAAIKRLDIPDLQYRDDVAKCVEKRYTTLQQQGWLRPLG